MTTQPHLLTISDVNNAISPSNSTPIDHSLSSSDQPLSSSDFSQELIFGAQLITKVDTPLLIEKYKFSNGLTLIYHPDHGAPLLSFQTWVPVGSAHEKKGKTGIAHLFEHLMFKATRSLSEGEFDRKIEAVGGQVNAATWLDWTYYYEDVPSAHFELVVKLEVDRLQHLLLNSEQLESERKVVMNERQECVEDDSGALLDELLWSMAFEETYPYAHPTIGWMSDIQGLSLEDCEAFYRTYYAPNQVILVVCGDVKREHLISTIELHYGSIPTIPPPPTLQLPTPHLHGPIEQRKSLTLYAPRLHLGFVVPTVLDPKIIALECLDELLFEGDSARLYRALVFEREWAVCVYSSVPQFKGVGLYEITVELLPNASPEATRALILDELRSISQDGLDSGELEKVKHQKELNTYRGLQTVQQRAQALGFWETTVGDFQELFERPRRLAKVTSSEVCEVAKLLLEPSRQYVLIGQPLESRSEEV